MRQRNHYCAATASQARAWALNSINAGAPSARSRPAEDGKPALLVGEDQRDAPVLLSACSAIVGRHRQLHAAADRLNARRINAATHQRARHRVGAPLRQRIVVAAGSVIVGMAFVPQLYAAAASHSRAAISTRSPRVWTSAIC